MRSARAAAALAMVAALAGPAAGQVPDPPVPAGATVDVVWAWTPGEPAMTQGSTLAMAGLARVTVRDAACPQGGTLAVQLALAAEGAPGLGTDPAPLSFEVEVPPGVHGVLDAPPWTTEVEVAFLLLASALAPAGHHVLAGVAEVAPPSCVTTRDVAVGTAQPPALDAGFAVRVVPAAAAMAPHPAHEAHGPSGFDLFLEPGATRGKQLNLTGTVTYHDHLKPELKGRIVVEAGGPAEARVQVTAQGFNPAEARIGPGGWVNWTNADSVAHTISADELHPEHLEPADEATLHEQQGPGGHGDGHAHEHGGEALAPTAEGSQPPQRDAPGAGPLGLGAALLGALGLAGLLRRRGGLRGGRGPA